MEEVVVVFIIAYLSPSASLGVVRVVAVEVIHRRQGRSNPRIKNVTTFVKEEIMMTVRLLVLSFDQEGGH